MIPFTIVGTIVEARDFSMRAHGSQKYGEHPYVVHLDEVAEIALHAALALGRDTVVVCAIVATAYVHDVLEDTDVHQQAISNKFGPPVATCAELLSDPPGKNRKERKAALHERLASLDPAEFTGCAVLIVKACDRLANLRRSLGTPGEPGNPGLLKMYREEASAFRLAAYRPGLCDLVWQEIDRIISL